MDKYSADFEEQDDWNNYKESEKIDIYLSDTNNESDDSEILPRRRKRPRRLISNDSESSGSVDTSPEEWIWEEIDNVPKIKKFTEMSGVNALILRKLGANPKSFDVLEEVLNMNFWEILSTETNRYAEQELKKEYRTSKKMDVEWFPVTVDEIKAYFALCIIMSQIKKADLKMYWSKKANSKYANIFTDYASKKILSYITLSAFCR